MRISPRIVFAAVFLVCAALIAGAYYLQEEKGIDPCPMCILQRYAFAAIGIVALAALAHGPRGLALKAYGILIALLAIGGGSTSVRQSWLQHNPPKTSSCVGSDLEFIVNNFPLSQAIPKIFAGSGDCAAVHWKFLELSLAEWALVWFTVILAATIWAAFIRKPS